jgi:hypothetical protein
MNKEKWSYLQGFLSINGTLTKDGYEIESRSRYHLEYMLNELNISSPIKQEVTKYFAMIPTCIVNENLDDVDRWAFIRGVLDAHGDITTPGIVEYPVVKILMKKEFGSVFDECCDIPFCAELTHNGIIYTFEDVNALDLLGNLYEDSTIHYRKFYKRYIIWQNHISSGGIITGESITRPVFKFRKSLPEAEIPSKSRISDTGYDLTLVKVEKVIEKNDHKIVMYDTGIQIASVLYGWYFDIVPNEKLSETGYVMTGTPVINRNTKQSIKVILIKVNNWIPDLILPFKAVLLLPRPIIHCKFEEIKG